MRTGAEPFAGGIAWTAFPANPRVPPIFPLRTGKHHAGVAELVDALVLGSGQSALQNNSLRSPSHWIVGANVQSALVLLFDVDADCPFGNPARSSLDETRTVPVVRAEAAVLPPAATVYVKPGEPDTGRHEPGAR
jgi:hypothetical protein